MNSARAGLRVVGAHDLQLAVGAHGLVRRDVEGVPDLLGDDDRGHLLEVAQLDDLVVHRRRDDRIEAGGRSRRTASGAASTPSRGRSPTRRRWPPDRSDGMRSMKSPSPRNPSTSSTRARTSSGGMSRLLVEAVADVLADGERIEQRVLLEHHADVGAHRSRSRSGIVVDALAVDEDRAGVRPQQAENQLEHHRLPRAARAQQDPHRSLRDA